MKKVLVLWFAYTVGHVIGWGKRDHDLNPELSVVGRGRRAASRATHHRSVIRTRRHNPGANETAVLNIARGTSSRAPSVRRLSA